MLRPLLLLAALGLLVAGDDPDAWRSALLSADARWRQAAQELAFNNESDPQTLDPGRMTGVLESRLALCLFEGLVVRDPRTLEPRPGLARSWTASADGLAWTFHLRPDARWSDGAPLTAAEVAASWRRVLDPALASEYAYMLFPIAGAEAFHRGTGPWSAVGVAASGAHVLHVRLHQRTPWFLDLCAFPTLLPVRTELADAEGRWTRSGMISNGPFMLRERKDRQHIILEPNPHYWDRTRVRLTRITARPIESGETAWKLFQAGELHWTPTVPIDRIDEIKRHPDYYAAPNYALYYYRFNVTRAPFDDVRVRRAFALATDRERITRTVTRGGEIPTAWYVPRSGTATGPGLAFDVAAARRELAAAGYAVPGGSGGRPLPEIPLLYNTKESHKLIAEALAQQWQEHLGARIRLENAEWKVYLDRLTRLDYTLGRSSWSGDYLDPNTFLDMMVTDGGNNRTGWSLPEYDRLVAASQAEADPARRAELLLRLERLLTVEHLPVLPLYTSVSKGLLSEKVHGLHANLLDHRPLQFAWLEP